MDVLTRRLIILGALTFVGAVRSQAERTGAGRAVRAGHFAHRICVTRHTESGRRFAVAGLRARARRRQSAHQRHVAALDIRVAGVSVDFGTLGTRSIATGTDGRATVTYTAPPEPPPTVTNDTTVAVVFTPIGTDFSNAEPRQVSLQLLRSGLDWRTDRRLAAQIYG